jgi:hypothetical protein
MIASLVANAIRRKLMNHDSYDSKNDQIRARENDMGISQHMQWGSPHDRMPITEKY